MSDIKKNEKKTDSALFDKTLRQIEKTLEELDGKIDSQEELRINEKKQEAKSTNDEEHAIDNTHLNMEELHSFSSEGEIKIKEKIYFSFYTYLALIVGIIFATYEILNVSKNLIISKYPVTEPYIEYFYEVIEILAYVVMNIVSLIKNLF